MKDEDYIGKKFGRLTPIKRIENNKHGRKVFICLCECGNKLEIPSNNLNSGNTTSCGCYRDEVLKSEKPYKRKYNTYDLSRDFGIGYTLKNEEFYFDLEDFEIIKDYYWRIHRGYVETSIRKNTISNTIYFHNLVMGKDSFDKKVIDHINRVPYDNRKVNLRIVDEYENTKNKSISKVNKSGVTGVEERENGTWRAVIRLNGKRKTKTFKSFDEAVKQRYSWEDQYGFIGERPE